MEILGNYAFTRANEVGKAGGATRTPLVEGQTIKGETVVCLCPGESFTPSEDRAALVYRNAEGEWTPFNSLNQFKQALAATPDKGLLAENLGVWRDRDRFLGLKEADGQVQNKEVESFAQRWSNQAVYENRQFIDLGYRPADPTIQPEAVQVGSDQVTYTVNPQGVKTLDAAFPNKAVAVLEEPRLATKHEIAYATGFEQGWGGLVPTGVGHLVHTPAGTTDQGSLPLNYNYAQEPVYVMVGK